MLMDISEQIIYLPLASPRADRPGQLPRITSTDHAERAGGSLRLR
jgi:hypothetical protein